MSAGDAPDAEPVARGGTGTPDRWDERVLPLATRRIGRPLLHYERVVSTMPLAHEFAARGGNDGAALLAEEQTGGYGRHGRPWAAPYGRAILCSLVCRPPLPPERLYALTAAVSLGLSRGIARATGLATRIKWPNDILAGERKLAGVLCTTRLRGEALDHAVVGFGVNVNLRADELPAVGPDALAPTSLALELGGEIERLALLRALLEEIDAAYDLVWQGQLATLRDAWAASLAGLGTSVRVVTGSDERRGRLLAVADDGALLLETTRGVERVLAGDVVVGPRPAAGE